MGGVTGKCECDEMFPAVMKLVKKGASPKEFGRGAVSALRGLCNYLLAHGSDVRRGCDTHESEHELPKQQERSLPGNPLCLGHSLMKLAKCWK